MKKTLPMRVPSYGEGFRCIGGRCEDSCCIGWDIDIDKKTFSKYVRLGDGELSRTMEESLYRNRESYSRHVDYGRLAIRDSRWCPFLNGEKLCRIQLEKGEEHLSNVCYTFPRAYNILDGVCELTLFMSCPEAVRMLLSGREPLRFEERAEVPGRPIIHSEINTADRRWRKTEIPRLPELRTLSVGILEDRTLSIEERLIKLGAALGGPERAGGEVARPLEFLVYVIEALGCGDESGSSLFASATERVLESFPEEEPEKYGEILNSVVRPFIDEHAWALERYLVNAAYQENFPFSVNLDKFEGYVMMSVRYALLRFYLCGIGADRDELTLDDLASMIQVHTKILDHHKSFAFNLLLEIRRRGLDNLSFTETLLS